MTTLSDPKNSIRIDLLKSLDRLEFSQKKAKFITLNSALFENDEELQVLESFASRFARASDLFTSKYIRTYVQIREPGFRGSMLDYLNQAEKFGLIDSAAFWAETRELRNSDAHEYVKDPLLKLYADLISRTVALLSLRTKL